MRKLLLLASAVVLVDTSFYAAITPLLPDLTEEFGLSKTGAGVLAAAYPIGTFVGGLPGGWMAARVGVRPTVLLGLALMIALERRGRVRVEHPRARPRALRAGRRRRRVVGGRDGLAGRRRAAREARADDRLGDGRRDRGRAARAGDRRGRRPRRLRGRVLLRSARSASA